MGRGRHRLSARTVQQTKEPGVLIDGDGLRLRVSVTGKGDEQRASKRWLLRVMVDGKDREFAIGNYPVVSLAEARENADELRKAAKAGKPLPAAGGGMTFRQAFEHYWELKRPTLTHPASIAQWARSLEDYVFPKLGDRPVANIWSAEILDVLTPIWHKLPVASRRILERMRNVFAWAILTEARTLADPRRVCPKSRAKKAPR
jgi:Arm DNA-binding domain